MPQDKSILHRILIVASLSSSVVTTPARSLLAADVRTTVKALRELGVRIDESSDSLRIHGVGSRGFSRPTTPIDCENSGTTARLLMGLLAGQSFDTTLIGDASLSKRPMARLSDILNAHLGAKTACSDHGTLPLQISGSNLHGADVTLQVSSAQMKTALLLAGLASGVSVRITEPAQSRDHTERMLTAFGVDLLTNERTVELKENAELLLPDRFDYVVPGDTSAAAFFIVAAAILHQDIRIEDVGLNPTRTGYLDILMDAGVPVWYSDVSEIYGERRGTIHIGGARIKSLRPIRLSGGIIANVLDEIPALAVFAACADGTSNIADATELRHKESDRIAAIEENLKNAGVVVREFSDGLQIDGLPEFIPKAATVEDRGDHRIAMAMTILALRARGEVTIPDASVVSISFPAFFEALQGIAAAAGKTITIV